MRWSRRRRAAQERHPSSRLDLASLWGPDDDVADVPSPHAAADVSGPPSPDPAAPISGPPSPPAGRGPRAPLGEPAPSVRQRLPGEGRGRAARVALLAAVIVAGVAIDQAVGTGKAPVAQAATARLPTVAPAGALSSTWLCPALGASAASPVLGRLILANPSPASLAATVTVVPANGAPVVQHPQLPPYGRQTIPLETVAAGNYAAATVTFDGAAGGVEQEVHGALGDSVTPCATGSSNHWYFPTGATDTGKSEFISLYNPYPAPAIADLRFETDQGQAVPDAFQGVVVPGTGFTVLDIGARVRSRSAVAAEVDVRGGLVVADEMQLLSSGGRGLVLTLGAPAPAQSWFYANGGVGPGVRERFDVFNPGSKEAAVSVAPILDQGSAEPFDLSVPPEGVVSLEVDQQARIPPGVGEAWVLTSANGVPVVSERVITTSAPASARGTAATLGALATARRWVFAAGSTASGQKERLVIANPGGSDAHVNVVASGEGRAVHLPPVVVPTAGRVSVDVTGLDPADVVMLDVTSDLPVVAERALYGASTSNSVGIAGN